MTRLVAGIDSSTQSTTVVLRRLADGAVVGEARAPHPPTSPPRSEQDPRDWWQALLTALAQLGGAVADVAAVSTGGQGHGLVILGEDDVPLRPAKLWNDTESAPDAEALRARLPAADWVSRTGSLPGPALTVSKLAWTARCHPGLLARAARIMLPSDYIAFRLCGRAATERGGASGTGYFDPFRNAWDTALARLAAPEADWDAVLPDILDSSAAAGEATAALPGAVVGAGTNDNLAAALGMALQPGDCVISLGTSGTVYAIAVSGVRDESGAINGYADATGRFLPMVTTLNAAKVTDAFRRWLGVTTEEFDTLALAAPPGSEGVILVPYLDGERTPDLPLASGRLLGLRSHTSRAAIARAAVEGVLCGLLEGRERLRACGVRLDGRLLLTGGAARSAACRQVLADLAGVPVWGCALAEAAACGAAVQAAAALQGVAAAKQAQDWAPPLSVIAEPRADSAHVRDAYRAAVAA